MNEKIKKDWDESDKFLPQIIQLLSPNLINIAPAYDDQHKATDLITRDARIAVRTRKFKDIKYKDEFTIRSKRNGTKTEYEKIIAGWGDYLFYGFRNAAETQIIYWHLIDLYTFREHVETNRDIPNGDGTFFKSFRYDEFPPELIVKKGTSYATYLMQEFFKIIPREKLKELLN
jgi:hypothetical protein